MTATPTASSTCRVRKEGPRVGVNDALKLSSGSRSLLLSIEDNNPGLCVFGGRYDMRQGDDEQWNDSGDHDHFAVAATNSPGPLLDDLASTRRATRSASGAPTTGPCGIRTSAAPETTFTENDATYNGLIDDVLVNWAHMGVPCRKDDSPARSTPGTRTVRDNLIALKKQVGTSGGVDRENPDHLIYFEFELSGPPTATCASGTPYSTCS